MFIISPPSVHHPHKVSSVGKTQGIPNKDKRKAKCRATKQNIYFISLSHVTLAWNQPLSIYQPTIRHFSLALIKQIHFH